MQKPTHETDVHDLSLGVIHALAMVDVKALSYMQLRRLYAALVHATEDVNGELAARTHGDVLGDTVKFPTPNKTDNS